MTQSALAFWLGDGRVLAAESARFSKTEKAFQGILLVLGDPTKTPIFK
jgi:hypothetical protein